MSLLPAPCAPTIVDATVECGSNRATLTWTQSAGAVTYTVTVTGDHGHVASCSSGTTSCSLKVDCGRHYTGVVVGSTPDCNGIPSASFGFDTGTVHLLYVDGWMDGWMDE